MSIRNKIAAGAITTALITGAVLVGASSAQASNVKIYAGTDYTTYMTDFGAPPVYYVGSAYNDRTTSLKVVGTSVVLWQNSAYSGRNSTRFYTGSPDLAGFNFDNITSSIN